MSESLTITIPVPHKGTHPNAPPPASKWAKIGRCKRTAEQRGDARLAALAALNGHSAPRWELASIQATFHLGTLGRKHDEANLNGWLKATADGLQDAGIIVNDSGLTWLAPAQVYGKTAGRERKVVLVLTKR